MNTLLPNYFISQFRNLEDHLKVGLITKETGYNALSHNARNMIIAILEDESIGDGIYLLVATDADPFLNENKIISALKLASGETGIQGSGIISCGVVAVGKPFDHMNYEIILYSNNLCFSSTAIPKDEDTGNYTNTISNIKELIPIIQKIIGVGKEQFNFKDGKKINVLHLFKISSTGKEGFNKAGNTLNASSLFGLRELYLNSELKIKVCIRNESVNSKINNLSTIFTQDLTKVDDKGISVKDHPHNRISSGISPDIYEKMYSWIKFSEANLKLNFPFITSGIKKEINATIDFSITLFPGIRGDHGQVTLRNVESTWGNKRSAGRQAGHDIEDSGNRIFLSFDNKNKRPNSDPVYVANDDNGYNASTFSSVCMGILMKSRDPIKDSLGNKITAKEFFESINEAGIEDNNMQCFDVLSGLASSKKNERTPYLKAYCKIIDSKVSHNDNESNLLKEIGMTSCFYALNAELAQQVIKETLKSFCKSETYKEFIKYYNLLIPKNLGDERYTMPISLINKTDRRVLEKIIMRVPEKNDNKKVTKRRKKKKE